MKFATSFAFTSKVVKRRSSFEERGMAFFGLDKLVLGIREPRSEAWLLQFRQASIRSPSVRMRRAYSLPSLECWPFASPRRPAEA